MRWRRHPSKRSLHRWLAVAVIAEADTVVDAHVARCSRCATRLEEFAEPAPALPDALSQSLQPPDDLVRRLGTRMNDTIRDRRDLALFFDLMGVSLATVRSLMEDDDT